jgi:hypothetical protein
MWSCTNCGRMHERLYDARWRCPCRTDPNAARAEMVRLSRGCGSMLLRCVLGLALGAAAAAIAFSLYGMSPLDGLGFGTAIGLPVGALWGLSWAVTP